ncbi:MAG: acyl carrier protein [Rhizobiales bacterium]|nr:acyl carrier protein [Hyphomicrobiales bacterium]
MNGQLTLAAAASPQPANPSADAALGRIMTVLAGLKPLSAKFNPTAYLADAGFSSIDMVKVMLAIEAEFDLMIPQPDITPENFGSARSIADMMARLTA